MAASLCCSQFNVHVDDNSVTPWVSRRSPEATRGESVDEVKEHVEEVADGVGAGFVARRQHQESPRATIR